MTKLLLGLTGLALLFACDPGTTPAGDAGGPSGDAGTMTPVGPLPDNGVLGGLDAAQLRVLCEEDATTEPIPTREQACTIDALLETSDSASCNTARDACMMSTAPAPGPADCAAEAPGLASELMGCSATVAQYRACRESLDAIDRDVFTRAECSLAGMLDTLFGDEPAGCEPLWAACPDVFGSEPPPMN